MSNSLRLFWRAKRTLRVRLTAWYMLLLGCTLVVFSVYLYLQLKYNLLGQLDTTLEVTASEMVTNVIVKNNQPQFQDTESFQLSQKQLVNAGFAGRVINNQGKIWDSFGNFQAIPLVVPKRRGYINLTNQTTIWRVYSIPLVINGDRLNPGLDKFKAKSGQIWLQVAQSLQPVSKALDHLFFLMLFGFPVVLFLAGLGGLFLADRALRPINRIIRIAEAISPDDFSRRINYQGVNDEVGRLAITLDRMLDRIESAFEHERRFIADASHELRTPLTAIKGRIGVTRSRLRAPQEYEATLQDLDRETDRLIRLTNGLLFLARLEQEELTGKETFFEVDLSNLLEVLVEQIQLLATNYRIDLQAEISPQLSLLGNCDLLTSLFLNLLDNAVKYTPTEGQIKLTAKQEQQQIMVTVSNTGKGIASEHLPHLFTRFYRIEGDRSRCTGGAGLGLAIAALIVRCHGGKISVSSQINQLTTFQVILPCQLNKLK